MKVEIPRITTKRLEELLKTIKPLVRDDNNVLCHINIEGADLKNTSFTWSPKITEKAEGLEVIHKIKTLHTYGFPGFFKPSIAEVLAFISKIDQIYLQNIHAFEVVGPDDVYDLNIEKEALDAGFHVAKTILYKKKDVAWNYSIK